MTSRLARQLVILAVLSAFSVDAATAATCCVSSAAMCSATACEIPNLDGKCSSATYSADCGAPYYCSFDSALGCQTTNRCTAAKLKAVGKVARRLLKCDSAADAKGLAVDPACTSKALGALAGAFSGADALGPCPGDVTTLQNDINVFEGNLNTAIGNAGEPRSASRCDAKKVATMGKMADGFLAGMSKAARSAKSPFPRLLLANRIAASAIGAEHGGGGDCSNSTAQRTSG